MWRSDYLTGYDMLSIKLRSQAMRRELLQLNLLEKGSMSVTVLTEVREVDDTDSGRYAMAKSFTTPI
jgi:hypothetical protein